MGSCESLDRSVTSACSGRRPVRRPVMPVLDTKIQDEKLLCEKWKVVCLDQSSSLPPDYLDFITETAASLGD